LQESPLPGGKLEGISMKAGFLEKRRMEFPTELTSWREHRRNLQEMPVPRGKPEGIRKRVRFPEKKPKVFTK